MSFHRPDSQPPIETRVTLLEERVDHLRSVKATALGIAVALLGSVVAAALAYGALQERVENTREMVKEIRHALIPSAK